MVSAVATRLNNPTIISPAERTAKMRTRVTVLGSLSDPKGLKNQIFDLCNASSIRTGIKPSFEYQTCLSGQITKKNKRLTMPNAILRSE